MKIRSIKKLVSEFTCSLWPLRSQEFYSEVRFNKHFFIDLWAMLQTEISFIAHTWEIHMFQHQSDRRIQILTKVKNIK